MQVKELITEYKQSNNKVKENERTNSFSLSRGSLSPKEKAYTSLDQTSPYFCGFNE